MSKAVETETKTVKVEKELTENQIMQIAKNELKEKLHDGIVEMLKADENLEIVVGEGANYPGGKKDSIIVHDIKNGVSAKVDFTAPKAGTATYEPRDEEDAE